jgi:predicted small lipoprotein YifL
MRTLLPVFLVAVLAGCGLKDDLYLPAPEKPPDSMPAGSEPVTDDINDGKQDRSPAP